MEDFTTSFSAPAQFSEPTVSSTWGPVPVPSRPTPDEAFRYCAAITARHAENFPVASLFLPQEKRPYLQAIYAFSRIADDFADELDVSPAERLAKLQDWETMLVDSFNGRADHPVFVALAETFNRCRIPIEPFSDLLTAFKRDVVQNRYESFEDLLSYCRCSANPVGRLVLMVFGHRDEAIFKSSDAICTALQLTNFWQDIFVDLKKNRMYLPIEDLNRFGYTEDQWRLGVADERFRALLGFEVDRAKALFYDGAGLPSLVERELAVELKMVWFGGMAILKKLERRGVAPSSRPSLTGIDKAGILFRSLWYNDLSRYGRKKKQWDLT